MLCQIGERKRGVGRTVRSLKLKYSHCGEQLKYPNNPEEHKKFIKNSTEIPEIIKALKLSVILS